MTAESRATPSLQAATVTVLTEPPDLHPDEPRPDPVSFDADIRRIDEPSMELLAHRECEPGTLLKIEAVDAIWLGEAEICAAGDGGFLIQVRLRHVLRDFETLARLSERFGTAMPADRIR